MNGARGSPPVLSHVLAGSSLSMETLKDILWPIVLVGTRIIAIGMASLCGRSRVRNIVVFILMLLVSYFTISVFYQMSMLVKTFVLVYLIGASDFGIRQSLNEFIMIVKA